jgi:DNA ligase (NAD+)
MPSIEKFKDINDVKKFVKDKDFVVSYKLDGSSMALYYDENERFYKAATRGTGDFGEDRSIFFNYIDIPKYLEKDAIVWGEVLIDKVNFENLKIEMIKRNLEPVKNIRNAVAGILNRKDNIDLAKYLTFVAHNVWNVGDINMWEKFQFLENHFYIPFYGYNTNIEDFIDNYLGNEYKFLTDGLVFTYNSIELCNDLNNKTSHHYRWNCAYKTASEILNTTVKNIIWQVGRSGKVTPVLEIEPVFIGGANISRCTAHNYKFIKDNNIGIGTVINITRSNEVIPKCLGSVDKLVYENNTLSNCPECNSSLSLSDTETDLVCNNENCRSVVIGKLLHFVKTLDIEGLNDKTIEKFYDTLSVRSFVDIFKITKDNILKIDGFKEKSADNIYNSINNAKNGIYYDTFIESLGINNIGKDVSKKLIRYYNNIDNLYNSIKENGLIPLENVGEKISKIILDNCENIYYICNQLKDDIKFLERKDTINTNTKTLLNNKVFILSGGFSQKKSEIEDVIIKNGGCISNSVNKTIDFLVTNETSTSKYEKAIKLNKTIINEEMLKQILIKGV